MERTLIEIIDWGNMIKKTFTIKDIAIFSMRKERIVTSKEQLEYDEQSIRKLSEEVVNDLIEIMCDQGDIEAVGIHDEYRLRKPLRTMHPIES